MDKIELKNKIRALEGLTNEEKSDLINMLNHEKKYGLVWEDKPEEVEERLRDELPVLHEVKERAIVSQADDAPNHILIEGDNLEALTALSYTHAGKIDVIYIDPPYNTGNKDFVYNDSFVDSEDAFRHSKWLSFMDRRLKLAKGLLSDRGVIFISIDDNEQAQLKLLCDEVFGDSNNIGTIIWKKKTNGNNMGLIPPVHDYILSYAANINNLSNKSFGLPLSEEYLKKTYSNPDNDPRGPWTTADLSANHKGPYYPIKNPVTGEIHYPSKGRYWVFNEQETLRRIKEGLIIFGKSGNAKPVQKVFLKNRETKKKTADSWWDKYGMNEDGTTELTNIFNESKKFVHPKPTITIKHLLTLPPDKNATILDFFAGSGTTLHATMQLNKEDGGHRKCILVTNNENGICENVTYERNKRVINGYTTPKDEQVEGLHANTLRYYKTDFISRDQSPKNMRALVAASTELLCIKNDIYTEAPFAGRQFNPKYIRYFEDKHQRMLVIYDERAIAAIAKFLETVEIDERGKIKVYTFSQSRYAFDDEFLEVADKVELCALPAAIYDAYRQVLPKRKPKYLPEALVENETTETPNEARQGELNFDTEGGEA